MLPTLHVLYTYITRVLQVRLPSILMLTHWGPITHTNSGFILTRFLIYTSDYAVRKVVVCHEWQCLQDNLTTCINKTQNLANFQARTLSFNNWCKDNQELDLKTVDGLIQVKGKRNMKLAFVQTSIFHQEFSLVCVGK